MSRRNSVVEAAGLSISLCQKFKDINVVGFKPKSLLITSYGLIKFTLRGKDNAEIIMCLNIIWFKLQSPAQVSNRIIRLSY